MDLLINTFGTRIRSRGERIVLAFPDGKKQAYPARRIEKIIILRPSSISTGAVQLALEHQRKRCQEPFLNFLQQRKGYLTPVKNSAR